MYCRIGSASLKHETPRSRTFLFRFAFSSISWHSSSASKRNGERSGEGNPRKATSAMHPGEDKRYSPSFRRLAHGILKARHRVSPARDLAIYRPNNRTCLGAIMRRRHASPTRPVAALSSSSFLTQISALPKNRQNDRNVWLVAACAAVRTAWFPFSKASQHVVSIAMIRRPFMVQ